MKGPSLVPVFIMLWAISGCGVAPASIPMPPTATTLPKATLTAESVGDYLPPNLPRCEGLKMLDRALEFEWAGVDAVGEGSWYYYHCNLVWEALADFYRPKMTAAPYEWGEINWVVRPEGTLGVYFHTVRQSWTYLWFLTKAPPEGGSYLVVAQPGSIPLDLPCCK